MPEQQKKRRRKRYQQASAYAGDVRPTGVLGFMSSTRMVKAIFIFMGLALAAGGGVAIFGSSTLLQNSSSGDFVQPDDSAPPALETPAPTVEIRQYAVLPSMDLDAGRQYAAVISTDVGDIQVELFADEVPETVNNFAFLAEDGFYDDLVFHYVEPGFSAQTGDPSCQAENIVSCRGAGGPGYELEQEGSGEFTMGTLGMINGSQFFICLSEAAGDLEQFADYTPFGQVVGGLELMDLVSEATVIRTIEIR